MKRINTVSNQRIIGASVSHSIVMLGAGNVSTHISRHLHLSGHRISCIYSRTRESANLLAGEMKTRGTSSPEDIPDNADFYMVCVPDSTVSGVLSQFKGWNGTWLHTAGALSVDIFKGLHTRYGVFYPLQTLSRIEEVDLSHTPFLVEGSSPEVTASIVDLASSISDNVLEINSDTRTIIHLAAVFANNFTNHMVHIGQQILQENRLDLKLLDPILEETIRKVQLKGAEDAQTGPALRNDRETMQKHIELLKNHPEWEKIYTFMSRDISRTRTT